MKKIIIPIIVVILVAIITVGAYFYITNMNDVAEDTLKEYISKINDEQYEEMYEMIDDESKSNISEEDFIARNKNIYQGMDMENMEIEILSTEKENDTKVITYNTTMKVKGEQISFENQVSLSKDNNKEYKISWSSNLIFPELDDTDKVKVSTNEATRGRILDRNGIVLASNGYAYSVGIVPGKLSENKEEDLEKIAELLGITVDAINTKLSASWVEDDLFVPVKTIAMTETELINSVSEISGVQINSVEARTYPLGEAASQLTGYVQSITAEELEENEGYSQSSVIGKAGIEKAYESTLKGTDGIDIYIVDENGDRKTTILYQEEVDGEDVKLTIDGTIQTYLYNKLAEDEGLFVVMNYETGEILALVSTPSYDVNKMTLGLTTSEWEELSNDESSPMIARYLQSYCPGSTFKPITGAIGLSTGTLSTEDTFEYTGLSWQKDSSWGTYNITTLTAYSGIKNLKNALIHSDNIYFAQAALQIGASTFCSSLDKLLFNESIDFELNLYKSQYSNDENTISEETLLADSGYGQGEILVNPIHMASIYSAIANEGNMVKPYLEYREETSPEYLVEGAFDSNAANTIQEDLIQVVENTEGTANDMQISGLTIAGKTGTAELKTSKDETGETLGWFDCYLESAQTPYLVISMVENASSNGGSHYLIPIIKTLFENLVTR